MGVIIKGRLITWSAGPLLGSLVKTIIFREDKTAGQE